MRIKLKFCVRLLLIAWSNRRWCGDKTKAAAKVVGGGFFKKKSPG